MLICNLILKCILLKNESLTWNTTEPDFTSCFEKTVLVWVPCLWLILGAPLHFIALNQSKNGIIAWNWKNLSKIILSGVILATQLTLLVTNFTTTEDDEDFYTVDAIYPFLLFVAVVSEGK